MATILQFPVEQRVATIDGHEAGLEALRLVADGLSVHEIGVKLRVTDQAVERRLRRLLETLNARTLPHAVALALRWGLID